MKCPHFDGCKQQIQQRDLSLCFGELEEWDQEDCFNYKDLGNEIVLKKPSEWKKEEA